MYYGLRDVHCGQNINISMAPSLAVWSSLPLRVMFVNFNDVELKYKTQFPSLSVIYLKQMYPKNLGH